MELRTIRDGPRLVPATQYDLERVLDLSDRGRALRTVVTLDRSSKRHRWYWTFIGVVAEAIDLPVTALHVQLKAKAGLIDGIVSTPQGVAIIVQSTKYDEMGDDVFAPYVEKAKNIVFRDFLDAGTKDEVFRRVLDIMGEDKRR